MNDLAQTLRGHGIEAAPSHFAGDGEEEIYTLVVSGADAVKTWHGLRNIVEETGHWPVLLGGEDTEDQAEAIEERTSTPAEVIAAAMSLDPAGWLAERARELAEDSGVEDIFETVAGEWPEGEHASHQFVIPLSDLVSTPYAEVAVALVPTKVGWHAPAFLNTGGWNECPRPEVHASIMRRWHELYGAELVGSSHDVIEMYVTRPPRDRASALALAKEQYVYCPDVVDQGTQTLEGLAAVLLGGTAWYFWWD